MTLLLGRASESWPPGLNVREPATVVAVIAVFFVVATPGRARSCPSRQPRRCDRCAAVE
jgi:hypothetical protein